MLLQEINALKIDYDDFLQDYIKEKNKAEGFFYKPRLFYLNQFKTLTIKISILERQNSNKLLI